METEENLRESDNRDSFPSGADGKAARNATPATPGAAAASQAVERSTCEEEEWLCIWPPDPETIEKFRSVPKTKLDE